MSQAASTSHMVVSERKKLVLAFLFASFPLASIVMVHFFACAAALYLGHWPTYNNPDPGKLPFVFQIPYIASFFALLGAAYGGPFIVLIVAAWGLSGPSWARAAVFVWAVVAPVAYYALLHYDPVEAFDWFMD